MKVQGSATLLFNSEGLHLKIEDNNSSINFLEIFFDEKQTCQLLSRLSNVKCDMIIQELDKIGKTMEIDKIEFIIPNNIPYQERNKIAYKKAKEYCLSHCDTGWIPDNYFNSKNSFFTKDGQDYARCTIRRWI